MHTFLQSALSRAPLAALAVALPCLLLGQAAQAAQWKWRDAQGVMHYSDVPPPDNVPARDILQRPAQPSPALVQAQPPGTAASKPHPAASELEQKIAEKKKAEQEAQAQAKLQQQQAVALQNQQNCMQAQQQLQVLDSGQRMVQIDAQGQRVIMDDAQRNAERARIANLISQYCR
ncbi:MAG: DUF4124 domain-containing protein [Pseudomonadota bacterium]